MKLIELTPAPNLPTLLRQAATPQGAPLSAMDPRDFRPTRLQTISRQRETMPGNNKVVVLVLEAVLVVVPMDIIPMSIGPKTAPLGNGTPHIGSTVERTILRGIRATNNNKTGVKVGTRIPEVGIREATAKAGASSPEVRAKAITAVAAVVVPNGDKAGQVARDMAKEGSMSQCNHLTAVAKAKTPDIPAHMQFIETKVRRPIGDKAPPQHTMMVSRVLKRYKLLSQCFRSSSALHPQSSDGPGAVPSRHGCTSTIQFSPRNVLPRSGSGSVQNANRTRFAHRVSI